MLLPRNRACAPSNHACRRSDAAFAQSFNWDCGFACLEMALRALGVSQKDCSLQQLRSRVPSSSIW
eukprot:626102-Pleurochrysis_carterae.AAC.1